MYAVCACVVQVFKQLSVLVICFLFIAHQPGRFYRDVLNAEEKDRLCRNVAGHLKNAVDFIQERAVSVH